jgi:anthranilate synthase component 1
MPREAFEAMVARIVEYVHAGDAFQVVPSQRWTPRSRSTPFSIYRGPARDQPVAVHVLPRLRGLPDRRRSPEPLVTVTGGPAPRRGRSPARARAAATRTQDEAIAATCWPTRRSAPEHVMLVDLGRNDLGRVCEYGTVEVETFMAVETYSHLIHIVSSVGPAA